jgi:hypothetical protein
MPVAGYARSAVFYGLGRVGGRKPQGEAMYYFGMVMAGVGAGVLIGALTFVTLMLGVVIKAMIVLTAGPLVDKILTD